MENAMKSVNVSRAFDGAEIVDEVLSSERKAWIYKTLSGPIAFKAFGKGVGEDAASEIASQRYARLMGKSVAKAFPKGIPQSDAQWVAFLKTDASWAAKGYFRDQNRHRMDSLDESIGSDNEDDGMSLVEKLTSDGACSFPEGKTKPAFFRTPEVRFELPYVRRAFKQLTKSSGKEKREILRELFLEGREVDEVCARHDLKANAVYAIRFRFNEVLKTDGPRILEMLEAAA